MPASKGGALGACAMELTRNAPVLDGAGRALGLADVDVIRAYGIALQNDALAREAADGRRACEALLATREEKHLLARANAQLARANEMARADAERARAGLGLLQSQLEQSERCRHAAEIGRVRAEAQRRCTEAVVASAASQARSAATDMVAVERCAAAHGSRYRAN